MTTTPPHASLYNTGNSKLRFAHPSTQQHLLVWRDRPRSVMIIKKLGRELQEEFQAVLAYLAQVRQWIHHGAGGVGW
jgi:hypothetical protein